MKIKFCIQILCTLLIFSSTLWAKQNDDFRLVQQNTFIIVTMPGNTELKMRLIPSGSFVMGTPKGRLVKIYDETEHRVKITKDFWMGQFEVTQKQFESVMGYNPSFFKSDGNLPVENISWKEAMKFCGELNKKLRNQLPPNYYFSLPSEAQWEYACKAGKNSDFNNGKNLSDKQNCKKSNPVSWNKLNSKGKTHIVGQKKANSWGLYDMHGNVWEMCLDWYGKYEGKKNDPTGPEQGSKKVVRGGSFNNIPRYGRSSDRHLESLDSKMNSLGFRIVLTCTPQITK